MATWGKCDFRQIKRLADRLDKLAGKDLSGFYEACAKELAARLLGKVIKRTPVGSYPMSTGKKGGTLRRGWTIGAIVKSGSAYEIEVINPTEYASYVEYGHRTANHKGWVPGRFMLTISENELNSLAPGLLEKRLAQYLKEAFDGK